MEFFSFLAGCAALVWMAVLFRRGGLIAGCLLVLLAGACFGHAFFHVVGPLPITLDRALLGLVAVQYVAYRRLGWADPKPIGTTDWCFLAWLGLLTLSTFSHDWKADQSRPLAELLFLVWMPAAVYWIARQAKVADASLKAVFVSAAAFGLYLALTAVAEVTGQTWAVFPRYVSSPTHAEFLGRGRGPLLNPVGTGFLITLGWAASLLAWPRVGRRGRIGLLLLSLVYGAGVYATLTRSVWMGAAAALVLILASTLPKVWRPAVLGGTCVAAALFVFARWDSLSAFKRDKELSASEAAESVVLRPVLAMVAWQMFKDRPLLGCGYGHYRRECRGYLSDRSTSLVLEKARTYVQHNTFLALLTETGLLGMGLFIAVIAAWTLAAWRLWSNRDAPIRSRQVGLVFLAAMAAYLPNAMFHDLGRIPLATMSLFFLAGVSMACAKSLRLDRTASRVRSHHWRAHANATPPNEISAQENGRPQKGPPV